MESTWFGPPTASRRKRINLRYMLLTARVQSTARSVQAPKTLERCRHCAVPVNVGAGADGGWSLWRMDGSVTAAVRLPRSVA